MPGRSRWLWLQNTSYTQPLAVGGVLRGALESTSQALSLDVDGDGRQDIVELEPDPARPGRYRWLWLKNPGSAPYQVPATAEIFGNLARPVRVLALDVDGDGRQDIVELEPDPANQGRFRWLWLKNTGTAPFTQPGTAQLFGNLQPASQAVALDVDGDGRQDIVELEPDPANQGRFRWLWLKNTGTAPFTQPGTAQLFGNLQPASQAVALDVDGDGRQDIVELEPDPANQGRFRWLWLKNTGTAPFTQPGTAQLFGNLQPASQAVALDVDGDGRQDIVELEPDPANQGRFRWLWLKNTGTAPFTQPGTAQLFGNLQPASAAVPVPDAIDTDADSDWAILQIRDANDSAARALWASVSSAEASRIRDRAARTIPTSAQYGGDNLKADTDAEADAVIAKLRSQSDADAPTTWNGLTPTDQDFVRNRANATIPSSVTYGGSNWKVDTEAEVREFSAAYALTPATSQAALLDRLHADDQSFVLPRLAPDSPPADAETDIEVQSMPDEVDFEPSTAGRAAARITYHKKFVKVTFRPTCLQYDHSQNKFLWKGCGGWYTQAITYRYNISRNIVQHRGGGEITWRDSGEGRTSVTLVNTPIVDPGTKGTVAVEDTIQLQWAAAATPSATVTVSAEAGLIFVGTGIEAGATLTKNTARSFFATMRLRAYSDGGSAIRFIYWKTAANCVRQILRSPMSTGTAGPPAPPSSTPGSTVHSESCKAQ